LLCFSSAIFRDGQFGYRDAGHYYYPLYQRVQREWDEHRWPLWEPEENAGMPLLGNPTAAVLYPGKIIYAILPYAWAARVYTMAHVVVAFAAMLWTLRAWKVSTIGSALGALSYAFGAPVLFQYCNIIYLVGAAWLPLGFLAADRWIQQGSMRALIGLSLVLALQTLGGDPQSSYLLGLCSGSYALGMSWKRTHRPGARRRRFAHRWWLVPVILLVLVGWVGGTLYLAQELPRFRGTGRPAPALWWMLYVPRAVLLAWGGVSAFLIFRWVRQGWRQSPGPALSGLAFSAALAIGLTAAQLLPVIEFTQETVRANPDAPHDIYPFSIEPFRIAELVWPNVFGTSFGRNANWLESIRFPGVRQKIWVPSLYLGCFSLLLAARAFTLRSASRRVWLSAIVLISVLGSLGPYTSPIWAGRLVSQTSCVSPGDIGPLDAHDSTPIRLDGYLRDGDGSVYWWLTTLLPGFRQFRFPAKLFTFSAFGLAALAGMGWDTLATGRRRGTTILAAILLVSSLVLACYVLTHREPLLRTFGAGGFASSFGPLDPAAAYGELVQALIHGSVVLAAILVLIRLSRSRPALAGAVLLLAATTDIALANARFVTTVPQSLFETEPEVLRILREAEEKDPSPGPYRVHRMPQWNPLSWLAESSDDRTRDFVSWERGTLQPKYGINLGLEYTHTMGVAELYDYEWFFSPFSYSVRDRTAEALGLPSGERVVYFPRRSFDIWNTRYFVLPLYPNGWLDEFRGYASFWFETDQIYPPPGSLDSPSKTEEMKAWIHTKDYQIRRNRRVYPRAWVVHQARGLPHLQGRTRAEQASPMQEMLYANDPIWQDPTMTAYDPRMLVWLDPDAMIALERYRGGQPPSPSETVQVSYPDPQHAVLEATLESPGIVVLADVDYPGWTLTIDEKPAPIYRVNRLMRGAAVPSGKHRLEYVYAPRSFLIGKRITLASMAGLLLAACFSLVHRRPRVDGELRDGGAGI
jgi:hypothetical protein